jgi:adenosylcobinamide-phosphate synthase
LNAMYLFLPLIIGVGLCFMIGDPSNKFHPVAWLGKIIWTLSEKLRKSNNSKIQKLTGSIFTISLTSGICIISQVFSDYVYSFFGAVGFGLYAILVVKSTVAILTMEKHATSIILALQENDMVRARENLSYIVSRNTTNLDSQHVLSGTIESVGESIVDGIVSPLFYYCFFGPAGAIGYRIVNTMDSMVGYKDRYNIDLGWMSAKADTILNFIPARLSAILMILSARIIGADWRNSIHVLSTDHSKTSSVNAGYPMCTMAGALRVKLEKIGEYTLGIELEQITIDKCKTAIKIMQVTALIFCILISLPIVATLSLMGWWNLIFGF